MKATKILSEEISDMRVAALPTRPTAPTAFGGKGYTAEEMKAAFDRLPLFIIERFNALLEDIAAENESSLAHSMKTGLAEEHTLGDMFSDIGNGSFASYLSVGEKSLMTALSEIYEALSNAGIKI